MNKLSESLKNKEQVYVIGNGGMSSIAHQMSLSDNQELVFIESLNDLPTELKVSVEQIAGKDKVSKYELQPFEALEALPFPNWKSKKLKSQEWKQRIRALTNKKANN